MTPAIALLLGIVEGLTEYLPVSSTGHLHLAALALGVRGELAKSFEIVIQLGAILAVLVHFRELLWARARGLVRGDANARRLFLSLTIAFVPVAILGVLCRRVIKERLFGLAPIAGALVAGGVVMIAVELWRRQRQSPGLEGLEHVSAWRALAIGLAQCLSLWPGASRAMCTILAGQLSGLCTATAAEFAFLLGLPTLGAATLYEGYKARHELAGGGVELLIGIVVSFLVAWAVIAAFLRYLKSHGLLPFGLYRIALGGVALWLAFR